MCSYSTGMIKAGEVPTSYMKHKKRRLLMMIIQNITQKIHTKTMYNNTIYIYCICYMLLYYAYMLAFSN